MARLLCSYRSAAGQPLHSCFVVATTTALTCSISGFVIDRMYVLYPHYSVPGFVTGCMYVQHLHYSAPGFVIGRMYVSYLT